MSASVAAVAEAASTSAQAVDELRQAAAFVDEKAKQLQALFVG